MSPRKNGAKKNAKRRVNPERVKRVHRQPALKKNGEARPPSEPANPNPPPETPAPPQSAARSGATIERPKLQPFRGTGVREIQRAGDQQR